MSESSIPMYAVVDRNKISADNLYSSITIENQNSPSNIMKNDEVKVKKSSSENLCDKRFLCLLVAIIVIIVTFCVCFLLAFLQISELRSERATVQQSQSSANNITATVDRMVEEKFNMLYHQMQLTEDVNLNASINKFYLQLENTIQNIENETRRSEMIRLTEDVKLNVSINELYLQLENTTQYIENETQRSEVSVHMLYNWLLSEDVAQQVNPSSLQLSEMFENEIRWLILDALESPGLYQDYPAASCASVLRFAPSSPSGLYWVRSSNGSAVRVYCDMTKLCSNTTGGWMRVVELDMTDNSTQCPSGLRLHNRSNLRTCGINSDNRLSCSSTTFNTNGIRFSRVHGLIRAYGCGTPDGYSIEHERQNFIPDLDIDSNYVDGISLTYGMTPRQHVWTFAVGHSRGYSPSFIHNDDYSGDVIIVSACNSYIIDIQWSRGSCGSQFQCCSLNNPTQFYKQLPQPTTDDIEMRLCRDQSAGNENIFIDMIDLYVQ